MPDFDQQGAAQTKEWVPETNAPAILLENVSKAMAESLRFRTSPWPLTVELLGY